MNPPEYHTVANELLPRFMFKLSKFLTFDNETLKLLCKQLDSIEENKTIFSDVELNQYFNTHIESMINYAYNKIAEHQINTKSINDVINEYNCNIRMPTNSYNSLLSGIYEMLERENISTDIITSASEPVTCNVETFTIITRYVHTWLNENKPYYVII